MCSLLVLVYGIGMKHCAGGAFGSVKDFCQRAAMCWSVIRTVNGAVDCQASQAVD
jgi:hypothetical protein